jgi:hypothetical protein
MALDSAMEKLVWSGIGVSKIVMLMLVEKERARATSIQIMSPTCKAEAAGDFACVPHEHGLLYQYGK